MARGRIYNNFYTPELWAQVNKENKLIIDDFIAEYKQRKKSKNTIYSYYGFVNPIYVSYLIHFSQFVFLPCQRLPTSSFYAKMQEYFYDRKEVFHYGKRCCK